MPTGYLDSVYFDKEENAEWEKVLKRGTILRPTAESCRPQLTPSWMCTRGTTK